MRALIPRPETELLADDGRGRRSPRGAAARITCAWDVAPGSGAVAVAAALDFRDAESPTAACA